VRKKDRPVPLPEPIACRPMPKVRAMPIISRSIGVPSCVPEVK
jgi:hypothetical protein